MRPSTLIRAGFAAGLLAAAAGAAPSSSPDSIDQKVLELLTPEQAAEFVDGADPETLFLADGRPLARHLEELLGAGAASLVFTPVDSCSLLRTTHSVAGKMGADEIRPFLARGETIDLSGQGGSALGCGIPTSAVALVLSVTVEDPDGSGRLKGWPVGAPQPKGDLLVYQTSTDNLDFFSLGVIGLCDLAGSCVAGDFNLRTTSASVHVRAEVAGYMLPVEECPAGSAIASIGADGAVVCEADDDTLAALACAVDEIAKWDGGAWTCAPDETGSVTDVWVDEAGDTMTGTLVLTPGGGNAIEANADVNLAAGNLLKSGQLFLHDNAGQSVAVGEQALASDAGIDNTAVGFHALLNNTTGTDNTAVGSNALRDNNSSANTAIGEQALAYNSSGLGNTAVGAGALTYNTSAGGNTATGYNALRSAITGGNNTAMGASALNSNTGGQRNVAVGYNALRNSTTADGNTAVGVDALYTNTTGYSNTAIGHESMRYNDTGRDNAAVGGNALQNNSSGYSNVAMGFSALQSNTTGSSNVALGANALRANDSGNDNIAIGRAALESDVTSHGNVVVGHFTMPQHTSGDNNVALGRNALEGNTTGSANLAIGHQALRNLTTGSTNIALGLSAGYDLAYGYDNIFIGSPGQLGDSGTIRIGTAGTHGVAFIAGIYATPVAGSPVVVDASGQLGVSASGSDADTLDGLDSDQFLRSDTSDNFTNGQITFDPGTTLRVEGGLDVTTAMNASTASVVLPTGPAAISGGGPGTGLDADLLDGLDSSDFLTAGTDLWVDEAGDTMTGTLVLNPGAGYAIDASADVNLAGGNVLKGGTLFLHDIGSANTGLGLSALESTTTGYQNTGIGHLALFANSSGRWNTAVGKDALSSNTVGYRNSAMGSRSLRNNLTGIQNTASGYLALQGNTSGSRNTGLGVNAGYNATTGDDNIFVGSGALGSPSDTHTIRIGGTTGVGAGQQSATYIAGIYATPLAGDPVVVTSSGQLGIANGPTGDADTLDGLDSSAFMLAGTDNWVDEAGDTMTGPLALPEDGLTVGTDQLAVSGGQVGINTASPQKDLHVKATTGVVFHNPSVVSPSTSPFLAIETDLYSTTSGIVSIVDRRQQTIPSRTPTLYLENTSGATDASNPLIEAKAAGVTRLLLRQDGRVGIGTDSPATTLEVTSVIRATPTDAPGSCSAAVEGGMYYDASLNEPCFCNGTDWQQFDGGGVCT